MAAPVGEVQRAVHHREEGLVWEVPLEPPILGTPKLKRWDDRCQGLGVNVKQRWAGLFLHPKHTRVLRGQAPSSAGTGGPCWAPGAVLRGGETSGRCCCCREVPYGFVVCIVCVPADAQGHLRRCPSVHAAVAQCSCVALARTSARLLLALFGAHSWRLLHVWQVCTCMSAFFQGSVSGCSVTVLVSSWSSVHHASTRQRFTAGAPCAAACVCWTRILGAHTHTHDDRYASLVSVRCCMRGCFIHWWMHGFLVEQIRSECLTHITLIDFRTRRPGACISAASAAAAAGAPAACFARCLLDRSKGRAAQAVGTHQTTTGDSYLPPGVDQNDISEKRPFIACQRLAAW